MASLASKMHNSYSPASFGWLSRDPMRDSRLLVNFTHSGVSFGSMHRDVVPIFKAFLDELVPLIPGGLVKGQCGCYNPGSRTVGGDRSFHTFAIAIDVNWGSNVMYAKSRPTGKYAIPAIASQLARKYGLEWGGDWSYPQDWMHFEVHLSPDDARAFKAPKPPKPVTVESVFPYWKQPGHVIGLISGPARYHGGATAKEQREVKAVVAALRAVGYDLAPTNTYTADVAKAVRHFQLHVMKVSPKRATGQVGLGTWRALRKAVRAAKKGSK